MIKRTKTSGFETPEPVYSAGVTIVVLVEVGGGTGSVTVVVRLTVVVVVVGGGGPETVSSLEHAPKQMAAPINKIKGGTVFMTCYYQQFALPWSAGCVRAR
jgi:hypothetical protein